MITEHTPGPWSVFMPAFYSANSTVPQSGTVIATEPDGWHHVRLDESETVVLRSPRHCEPFESGFQRWLERNQPTPQAVKS